jgi:hypothetical protein
MPDRLSESKNVKDFGAKGNGVTNDTAAIQAAVNWTSNAHRGVIFFPPGTYLTSAPIDLSANQETGLIFRGCGLASLITGNFAGYILDRNQSNGVPQCTIIEGLDIRNTNPGGGGIRLRGTDSAQVRNCRVQANTGIAMSGISPTDTCFDTSVINCLVNGLTSNPAAGSIGIMMGPETSVWGCGIVNFDHGIRAYGAGITIGACRIEVNNIGVCFGLDITGAPFSATAGQFFGSTMEGNLEAIYINAASGLLISGVEASFGSNAPPGSGSSVNGLHFWSGNNIVVSACLFNGAYTHAGIFIQGQPGGGQPGITFIGTNTSSFVSGPGVTYEDCEQINCQNIPPFVVPFAKLPSYAPEGARKFINNCSTMTFGAPADGAGGYHVPVYRDNVGWRVG